MIRPKFAGMGLCLCKKLAELLDGSLGLDESFHSGIEGCPGTRFVVKLNDVSVLLEERKDTVGTKTFLSPQPPTLPCGAPTVSSKDDLNSSVGAKENILRSTVPELATLEDRTMFEPAENLKVLVVDDDTILRRLITRTLQQVAPTWSIMQAANGETALRMTDDRDFDLIFVDQFMASVERSLLGTETTRALRARGVTARICGLSANNVEDAFHEAGANAFLQKPIPCKKDQILEELRRIFKAE